MKRTKMKKIFLPAIILSMILASCAKPPAAYWIGDRYIFYTWTMRTDEGTAWNRLSSDEPFAIFETDGEIRIFNNREKCVYRTKSPKAFLLRVAELHRKYNFDFIPIFELCGYFETPLIMKAFSDENLAEQTEHTKDENNCYNTYIIDGEEITFAGGVSWSFCKCGSDSWSWLEITEK